MDVEEIMKIIKPGNTMHEDITPRAYERNDI
jgi:hypothetical protein